MQLPNWLRWFARKKHQQRAAYAGAAVNRLTSDWILSPITSADEEIKGDLERLRGRSRELVRNNSYATRYIDLLKDNVIGPQGVRLQSRIVNRDGKADEINSQRVEDSFNTWGRPGNCTVDGRSSWDDVCKYVVSTRATDGEVLIRMVAPFPNRWGFALQCVDTDLLDSKFNRKAGKEGPEVRMGVEVDVWGRPLAYHLLDAHPSETGQLARRTRTRYAASQIIHLYDMDRAGQTRGVPDLAPVMLDLKMLAGYEEAELVAARTAAAKMGFFERDPESMPDPNSLAGRQTEFQMDAEPGVLTEFPVGVTGFHTWDPQHPAAQFDPFTKALLRKIAAGLGVSYVSLANNLEGVNYSSIRQGVLAERDMFKSETGRVVEHFCERVFQQWFTWALTTNADGLELPLKNLASQQRHVWQVRGFPWVDPLKDIKASQDAIALGVDSRTRVAAERGRDIRDVLTEIAREQEIAAELGVTITGTANGQGQQEPAEPPAGRSVSNGNGVAAGGNGNGNGAHNRIGSIIGEPS